MLVWCCRKTCSLGSNINWPALVSICALLQSEVPRNFQRLKSVKTPNTLFLFRSTKQNFEPYVDKIGLKERQLKPVEYLDDKELDFRRYDELRKYEESSLDQEKSTSENKELRGYVNSWADYQKQQNFLIQTPSILIGYRVQVYRATGTTQWFTAVIGPYQEDSKVSSRLLFEKVTIR